MSGPSKALRAFLSRVRPASEDIHEVMDATSPYMRYVGNRRVPTDLLNGGVGGASNDARRVQDLVGQMEGPDGYIRRLIADDAGDVVEGQHRLDALRGLEVPQTPIHLIEDMSRGYDLPRMQDAVSGLHPDQQTQMIRHALDGLRQYGSRAADELEMPSGYFSKYFQDAIRAAGEPPANMPDIAPLRRFYAEGGFVEPAGGAASPDEMALYGSQYYGDGGAVRRWLKTLRETRAAPLGVTLDQETIPRVIKDGRFKSLFETGTSNGSIAPRARTETEFDLLGLDQNLPLHLRPIYGHLFHPDEVRTQAHGYGDWTAALAPSVKARTTITYGDSLGATMSDKIGPYRFDEPSGELIRRGKDSPAVDWWVNRSGPEEAPSSFQEFARSTAWPGYLEAQIQGGLPWGDVNALISQGAQRPLQLPKLADGYGRPVYAREGYAGTPWFRATPGTSGVEEIGPQFPLSEIGYAAGGPVEMQTGGSAIRKWLRGFKDIFDKPVSVNFEAETLDDILRDGRFKSLHETGTSGGFDDKVARLEDELKKFGPVADPSLSPIYGHIQDRRLYSDVGNYGALTAILDPSVNARTTFTLADSLGFEGPHFALGQSPRSQYRELLDYYQPQRTTDTWGNPREAINEASMVGIANATLTPYIEAQVHGGLPWSDVRAALNHIVTRSGDRAPADLAPYADKMGVPVFRALDHYDPYNAVPTRPRTWWRTDPGNPITREIDPNDLAEFGYAEGGSVASPDEMALYGSQYYQAGGPVEMQAGGNALRRWLQKVSDPIKAWHGTPHTIDKFDSSKIGTGEGAQVYGHGLYFAENPEVAKWYRETLAGSNPDWFDKVTGKPVDSLAATNFIQKDLGEINPDSLTASGTLWDHLRMPAFSDNPQGVVDWMKTTKGMDPKLVDDIYGKLTSLYEVRRPGNLYEVGIHEDPNKFLSLDTPLNMQGLLGKRATDLLENLRGGAPVDDTQNLMWGRGSMPVNDVASPAFASGLLDEGIPGIRYLDGMSRSKGAGTHNYVVFPGADDIIDITGRYAEGGEVDEPEGYQTGGKAIRSWMRTLVDGLRYPIGVQFPDEALDKIMSDGRFKNSLETRPFDEGYNVYRRNIEKKLFDIPDDAPGYQRPIYGHLWHPEVPNPGYGDLNAVLHPSVKERSTFNWGDTFGNVEGMGPYRFAAREAIEGMPGLLPRLPDRPSIDPRSSFPAYARRRFEFPQYIETQTHGGVSWDDVVALTRPKVMAHPDDLMRISDRTGKPVWGRGASVDEDQFEPSWFQARPGYMFDEWGPEPPPISEFGYAEGGPVEMQTGGVAKKTANALIDYLSGIKSATPKVKPYPEWTGVPNRGPELAYMPTEEWWKTLPPKPEWAEYDSYKDSLSAYMGSQFREINNVLRRMAPGDTLDDLISDPMDHYAGIAGPISREHARKVADRLMSPGMTRPLEADVFRGTVLRGETLPDYGGGMVHGRGLGSFSYSPLAAQNFESNFGGRFEDAMATSISRIPKGTDIPHWDLRGIDDWEQEVLLPPRQGYKVTDVYVPHRPEESITGRPSVFLDIVPSDEYDIFTPAIYAEGGEVEDPEPLRGYFGGY